MADKPRVKAPKKRATHTDRSGDNRRMLVVAGGAATVLVAVVGAFLLLAAGGGSASPDAAREALTAAGCTLQAVQSQPGNHSLTADGTAKWNTDPPTSGPHYGFNPNGSLGTVIWGAYDEPVQLARIVHNLEHGGVYVLYGDKVPESVIGLLRTFYDEHKNGTLLAPYPKLGNKTALGAWVAEGESGRGYLAKCSKYDERAFSAFFSAFQFKGPERIPEGSLLPGGK